MSSDCTPQILSIFFVFVIHLSLNLIDTPYGRTGGASERLKSIFIDGVRPVEEADEEHSDTREQCRTTQPFCIKAYRRPTAEGAIILLKQVIASIHICGRHWGVLQMAYQDQG